MAYVDLLKVVVFSTFFFSLMGYVVVANIPCRQKKKETQKEIEFQTKWTETEFALSRLDKIITDNRLEKK